MKKIIITSLILGLISQSFAQELEGNQNPNYKTSLKKYSEELNNSPNTMASTVQNTYKAVDEWQDKKDAKIANKQLRISNRQDRRMARANNSGYYNSSPGMYYNYPNNYRFYNNYSYSGRYNSRNRHNRHNRNGLGVYPRIGYGVGANVGLGNVVLSF